MTSKYDRPDPSLDPDYTEGLSVEDNDTPIDPFDAQDIPEPEASLCFWCGQPLTAYDTDYCSAQCANYAYQDDCER